MIVGGGGCWAVNKFIDVRNGLVDRFENYNGGRAQMANTINQVSAKMESVWALAREGSEAEKNTYVGVAAARSGYDKACQEFEAASKDPNVTASALQKMLSSSFSKAFANINATFEAMPQNVKISENYQKAMSAVEQGWNQIDGAINDWINDAKEYNKFRNDTVNGIFAGHATIDGNPFPNRVDYYEGGLESPKDYKPDVKGIMPPTAATATPADSAAKGAERP